MISVVVITLALLLEYAVSDGGVLRWLVSTGNSIEEAADSIQQELTPVEAPAEETPVAEAAPEPDESPVAEESPPPPVARVAPVPKPANFGIRLAQGELSPQINAWLNWLQPGLPRMIVVQSKMALPDQPEVSRPPYSYGSDGRLMKGLDIDGYQVFPLLDQPPLAVSLLFRDGNLHNWVLYEQNTRGLAEDQAHMLALYAAAAAGKKPVAVAPAPALADRDRSHLVDPSFEQDPAADDPEWVFDGVGGDALGARTTDFRRTGRYAVGVRASRAANRGWPGWKTFDRFPVANGEEYLLRAHAMSRDGGNAWLALQLYDAAGQYVGGRSTGCLQGRPGPAWEVLELRYRADDPKVASVQLSLQQCLNHSAGRSTSVYFDDVYFGRK